ncbi:Gfo/Idh/MocA family oxidoreductase [Pelagibius litoralis]|uniref:Gfo/Idh/MocA family oxidoreductase n=1 Tax=Pelagibius litoralis TaxID=374515 RepID=A0A967EV77_9PROT|nr:Gfo/Idh/MocA family oxidoreductase [Pelagibius litoralis]NIA67429.1 Gfo/Idh/MocA family oxidoreductase [Pelagibius litoralis]
MRVGTVGTGYFSQFQYEAWSRMADVDLVALCNRGAEGARRTAEAYSVPATYSDLAEMLAAEKLDLLDIITPPVTHLEMIRTAATQKVAIICQKPFCQSLEEAEEAVALCEQAGVLLVVHENFRFQPWHQRTKALLDDGTLGEVYQASFRLRPGDGQGPQAYLDRQPYFQKMERFLVHETAIHLIDVFRFLLGEATEVYARLNRLNPAIAGEDAGFILLDFENGARGLFDGNRLADHAAENRRLTMGEMLIDGSKATLRLDGDGRLFLRPHGGNDEREVAYDWENRGFGGDCVFKLQRHVVDHLQGHGPIMNQASDYLANLRIEKAVYESNSQGRRLFL